MHRGLYLSHWDVEPRVFISPNIADDLTNYQIMAVRYLYRCYSKGQKGAILNEDEDMNFQIQISALFSALHTYSSIIVVCDKHSLLVWHYYLSKYTNTKITVISEQSLCTEYSKIILCPVDSIKWLQRTLPFFIVVIDDLDLNLNRKYVKQLKGDFHIGLTKRNFLRNPDQKLFRNMLLWAVPGILVKLEDFMKEDDDHLYNLRDAYSEWWLRLTWSFCDTFSKPSQHEKLENKARIKDWGRDHNVIVKDEPVKVPKGRKRKSKELSPPMEIREKVEPDIPTRTEYSSSQDTIICDREDFQIETNDEFSILTSIINDDVKPSNLPPKHEKKENAVSKDEVLSMLLDEPKKEEQESSIFSLSIVKDEDEVESRNRDVLSLLYGDGD